MTKMEWKYIKVGDCFKLDLTDVRVWEKRTSRTAQLLENKKIFYFKNDDICYSVRNANINKLVN